MGRLSSNGWRTCGWSAVLFIALTGCSGDLVQPLAPPPDPPVLAPPVIRDTITVTAWTRTPLVFPSHLSSRATRTANTFVAIDQRTVNAINPADGMPLWSATFPNTVGVTSTAPGTFVVSHARSFSDSGRAEFVDASTGRVLWSQALNQPGNNLVDASATALLARIGSTQLMLRDRASGAVRWVRDVTLGDCGLIESGPCLVRVGDAAGAFYMIRLMIRPSHGYEVIKVTDAGVVTLFSFADQFALLDVQVTGTVDASGQFVTVLASRGHYSVSTSTGALRWSAARLSVSNGVIMDRPVVHFTAGTDPLIHLIYRYSTNSSGGFSREIVRSATTGRIVRQLLRPSADFEGQLVKGCGPDGMVILRGGGRFIYIDTRTGTETAGRVVDAVSGASVGFPTAYSWVDDYSSGYLVFGTGGRNGQPDTLVGFRCRP